MAVVVDILTPEDSGRNRIVAKRKLGEKPMFPAQGNYYLPCPDPELTLGLNVHNWTTSDQRWKLGCR
ncbi:hypothetical protein V6N13_115486 [Hibiscus sabdariffa]|uniref:Uncharacterized protein n=1 Tax=Hibiscus sabdariffa TaxID=183260 RepID=A0ABR2CRX2_9ROSI